MLTEGVGDLAVRFTVLGPVEISADGRALPAAAPRHRAVLAYLLLHARTVISADRLIDAMWGQDPPDTARAQIHAAITAIRRSLRAAGAAQLLESRPVGYAIAPDKGRLDLEEFTRRLAAAKAEAEETRTAAAQIRAALALWRGEPLADVKANYVDAARARLQDWRLSAIERLADLELSDGRHDDLIDELTVHVAAHPLRERLSGQLMLALHRAGRQADALQVARTLRTALVKKQGLDPGRAFVALERSILCDDPDLHLSSAPAARRATAAGGQGRRANFLPYDIPDFAGRTAELDRLARSWSDRGEVVTISAIDGMAGIGKTALAIHVAHRVADRFPDGRLFIDLQANTPAQEPIEAGAALDVLLRQLGVPAEGIPPATSDRAALWRAELADRRVLVVLDNAAGTGQVRPLLPGAPGSLILITSRQRLTGLDGAQSLSMDVLPAGDATEWFTRMVGERAAAEPDAVLDVLRLCGFLPLAVRIAAARLNHRPCWTVQYLADRLRDQYRLLSELSTNERSIAAAFTQSYQQLDPDRQRLFRLLGLHPGRDIDAHAAAALAGLPLEQAESLLEDLLDMHVLAQHQRDRFTFHDLLCQHARDTALAEEPADARHQALTRLFDHYLHTARKAVDLLYPHRTHPRPLSPAPGTPAVPFDGPDRATAWLNAERANLIAAGAYAAHHDWPAHTNNLAATLHSYLDDHAHYPDALVLFTGAMHAGRRRGDKAAEAHALVAMGWACLRQGRYEEVHESGSRALDLSREIGERCGEARALNCLGAVYWRQNDHDSALQHFRPALDLYRELGDRQREADVLGNLGLVYERQGRYELARDYHQQSLRLHHQLGNRGGEADAVQHLGCAYQRQGRYEEAHTHHREALALFRELGHRSNEAEALNGLGEVMRAMGHPAQALAHHRAALDLAQEVGNRPEQARAHHGTARACHDLGDNDPARDHAGQALDLYSRLGAPEADEIRCLLVGLG